MLALRYRPELITPELVTWLRAQIRYDANGRFSCKLKDSIQACPQELEYLTQALGAYGSFHEIIFQAYASGLATTPCHTDGTVTGFSLILSIGAPRTFRIHRVLDPEIPCQTLLDVIYLECIQGSLILMEDFFHDTWHHQITEDPQIKDERLSLVVRTAKRNS